MPLPISNRDGDTILAALRYWQNRGSKHQPTEELIEIATNGDKHEALDDEEIDELCERINVDWEAPAQTSPRETYPKNPHDIIGKALATAAAFMKGLIDADVILDAQAVWSAAPGLLAAYPPELREPDNVRRFLDLSTGHLKPETREQLENGHAPAAIYPHPDGYGWMLYVPCPENAGAVDEEDRPAEDLQACFDKARELRCDYILFDSDAPELDGLPLYDDEGNVIGEEKAEGGD
jgi:hypothetical protein